MATLNRPYAQGGFKQGWTEIVRIKNKRGKWVKGKED
jgi:hypothetical protein